MTERHAIIGRAKALLVFGHCEASKAVTATINAHVRRGRSRQRSSRLKVTGFDPDTTVHLTRNVLAATKSITHLLCPSRGHQSYNVSVTNLAASAARDRAIRVTGFSADSAVFLALLSTSLRIPLAQDTATTGHIASANGDVRTVRSLPAKLLAASLDPAITRVVVPATDADQSLRALTPREREAAHDAIVAARRNLQVVEITDLIELLDATLDDEAILWGSLRAGFFLGHPSSDSADTPLDQACRFLGGDNERRFWDTLERHLIARQFEDAKCLLSAYARWFLHRKRYPQGIGSGLHQLLRSLPPTVRRDGELFPLVSMDVYLRLCKFVEPSDHEDVQHLLIAVSGRALPTRSAATAPAEPIRPSDSVTTVLGEINANALARKFGIPIDSARASFVLESVIIGSKDDFHDTIEALYAHLLRHLGTTTASAADPFLRSDSHALLERAFAEHGGPNSALAEARSGVQGGMRFVLDLLTDRFKVEVQSQHVRRMVAEAVDPLDAVDRTNFMAALLDCLRPHLPDDLKNEPPARFASHYPLILETYVRSLDRMDQVMRTF